MPSTPPPPPPPTPPPPPPPLPPPPPPPPTPPPPPPPVFFFFFFFKGCFAPKLFSHSGHYLIHLCHVRNEKKTRSKFSVLAVIRSRNLRVNGLNYQSTEVCLKCFMDPVMERVYVLSHVILS
uniref:Uncharacterized protein n=1 Tax=Cacopsylla melanoneura TaxID=428564 RepID=A0A8D9FCJ9_9HEMI